MLNTNVKAQCNLFGILKNIEYLAEHDVVSKELPEDTASTLGVRECRPCPISELQTMIR